MTRRHFEAAASLVRQYRCEGYNMAAAIDLLIDLFVAYNPRFNVARFREACNG